MADMVTFGSIPGVDPTLMGKVCVHDARKRIKPSRFDHESLSKQASLHDAVARAVHCVVAVYNNPEGGVRLVRSSGFAVSPHLYGSASAHQMIVLA